jgi:hypothetical protein
VGELTVLGPQGVGAAWGKKKEPEPKKETGEALKLGYAAIGAGAAVVLVVLLVK